jgi:cytochrome c nitrite reductase small subunit
MVTPSPKSSRAWLSKSIFPRSSGNVMPLLLAVVTGIAAGVGAYTFSYAKGLSYFGTDPKACVNCHIMEPEYAAWQKSSHHTVAGCVDCHLPASFIPKYIAKAENGYRHGKLFTTQMFEEPITVKTSGLRILQANCEHCHAALVHDLVSTAMSTSAGAHGPGQAVARRRRERTQDPLNGGVPCIHCHWTVGHGERAGLGGPRKADEIFGPGHLTEREAEHEH